MLIGIGRHDLQLPDKRLDQLRTIRRRLGTPRQVRMTERNLERLRQFQDGYNQHSFARLAEQVYDELAGQAVTVRRALLATTAVAHAILTNAPMRLANLLELDFEQHFRQVSSGSRATFIVSVPGSEVKNGQALSFQLSVQVADMLRKYHDRYRPVLAGIQSTLVFPRRKGDLKEDVTLSQQLCSLIRKRTGIILNPHLYRHIVAYIYLRACPGDFETVRQLLGHTSIDTIRRFYADFDRFFAQTDLGCSRETGNEQAPRGGP